MTLADDRLVAQVRARLYGPYACRGFARTPHTVEPGEFHYAVPVTVERGTRSFERPDDGGPRFAEEYREGQPFYCGACATAAYRAQQSQAVAS